MFHLDDDDDEWSKFLESTEQNSITNDDIQLLNFESNVTNNDVQIINQQSTAEVQILNDQNTPSTNDIQSFLDGIFDDDSIFPSSSSASYTTESDRMSVSSKKSNKKKKDKNTNYVRVTAEHVAQIRSQSLESSDLENINSFKNYLKYSDIHKVKQILLCLPQYRSMANKVSELKYEKTLLEKQMIEKENNWKEQIKFLTLEVQRLEYAKIAAENELIDIKYKSKQFTASLTELNNAQTEITGLNNKIKKYGRKIDDLTIENDFLKSLYNAPKQKRTDDLSDVLKDSNCDNIKTSAIMKSVENNKNIEPNNDIESNEDIEPEDREDLIETSELNESDTDDFIFVPVEDNSLDISCNMPVLSPMANDIGIEEHNFNRNNILVECPIQSINKAEEVQAIQSEKPSHNMDILNCNEIGSVFDQRLCGNVENLELSTKAIETMEVIETCEENLSLVNLPDLIEAVIESEDSLNNLTDKAEDKEHKNYVESNHCEENTNTGILPDLEEATDTGILPVLEEATDSDDSLDDFIETPTAVVKSKPPKKKKKKKNKNRNKKEKLNWSPEVKKELSGVSISIAKKVAKFLHLEKEIQQSENKPEKVFIRKKKKEINVEDIFKEMICTVELVQPLTDDQISQNLPELSPPLETLKEIVDLPELSTLPEINEPIKEVNQVFSPLSELIEPIQEVEHVLSPLPDLIEPIEKVNHVLPPLPEIFEPVNESIISQDLVEFPSSPEMVTPVKEANDHIPILYPLPEMLTPVKEANQDLNVLSPLPEMITPVKEANEHLPILSPLPEMITPVKEANLNLNVLSPLPEMITPVKEANDNLHRLSPLPEMISPVKEANQDLNVLCPLSEMITPDKEANEHLPQLSPLPEMITPVKEATEHLPILSPLPEMITPVKESNDHLHRLSPLPEMITPVKEATELLPILSPRPEVITPVKEVNQDLNVLSPIPVLVEPIEEIDQNILAVSPLPVLVEPMNEIDQNILALSPLPVLVEPINEIDQDVWVLSPLSVSEEVELPAFSPLPTLLSPIKDINSNDELSNNSSNSSTFNFEAKENNSKEITDSGYDSFIDIKNTEETVQAEDNSSDEDDDDMLFIDDEQNPRKRTRTISNSNDNITKKKKTMLVDIFGEDILIDEDSSTLITPPLSVENTAKINTTNLIDLSEFREFLFTYNNDEEEIILNMGEPRSPSPSPPHNNNNNEIITSSSDCINIPLSPVPSENEEDDTILIPPTVKDIVQSSSNVTVKDIIQSSNVDEKENCTQINYSPECLDNLKNILCKRKKFTEKCLDQFIEFDNKVLIDSLIVFIAKYHTTLINLRNKSPLLKSIIKDNLLCAINKLNEVEKFAGLKIALIAKLRNILLSDIHCAEFTKISSSCAAIWLISELNKTVKSIDILTFLLKLFNTHPAKALTWSYIIAANDSENILLNPSSISISYQQLSFVKHSLLLAFKNTDTEYFDKSKLIDLLEKSYNMQFDVELCNLVLLEKLLRNMKDDIEDSLIIVIKTAQSGRLNNIYSRLLSILLSSCKHKENEKVAQIICSSLGFISKDVFTDHINTLRNIVLSLDTSYSLQVTALISLLKIHKQSSYADVCYILEIFTQWTKPLTCELSHVLKVWSLENHKLIITSL